MNENTEIDRQAAADHSDGSCPRYKYRRPAGECAFCDAHRDDCMMPSHTPSDGCESGKHPHCTCDTCF